MTKLLKQRSVCRFLLAAICVLTGFASMAQVTVKGKVTGANGAGISNATVQLEPGNAGTNTDASGNYTIFAKVRPGKYTLVFSSVGFKRQTKAITISDNDAIDSDVTLSADPLGLDEVVVTGFGTPTRKKQIVNSISTVSGKDLSLSGAQSIDAAMQGKVAGAQINQNSGGPAGGVSVRLRGPSTIAGDSEPLYIIDGVIVNNDSRALLDLGGGSQNRLADLNMNDVDRIEVVKGAAAAAIYGSRASNGVVQIFTKRGKEGTPQFSFSTSIKSSSIRKKLETNTLPFKFVTPAGGPTSDLTKENVQRYDYQDYIFTNAIGTENNLSVSGGNGGTRYFASASNYYNQGIVRNTDFNRNGLRIKLNQKVNNKIAFSVGANYIVSSSNDIPNGGVGLDYGAITGFIFGNNYNNPNKNPITGVYPFVSAGAGANPYEVIDKFKFNQITNRIVTDFNINYKPIAGLTIDLTSGFDSYTQSATAYLPPNNTTANFATGFAQRGDVTVFQTNTDLNVTYQKGINSWLNSTTIVGGTIQYDKVIKTNITATQLGLFGQTTSNGITLGVPTDERVEKSVRGAFIQQTFGINNNLFINAAGRFDGSSVFSKDYASIFYPKVGASYILSNEKFFKGISNAISFFKLRAAWGQSGNLTGIGAYDRFSRYNATSYGSQVGYVPSSSRGNVFVRPERQVEFEAGFDANFIKDRITVEFNYFSKKVKDLIINKDLSLSTGFENSPSNVGNLTNTGIEFLIRAIAVKSKNVEWTTSISYLQNKNIVTDIPTFDGVVIFPGSFSRVAAVNGQPLGGFYATFFARNPDGTPLLNAAGLPQVERGVQGINGNYTVQRGTDPTNSVTFGQPTGTALVKVLGNPLPKHVVSFINTVTIKALTIKMQWDGMYGFDVFNFAQRIGDRGASFGGLKGYEKELNGEVKKGTYGALAGIFENWVEKGDFTKLRELSITYMLPNKIWKFRNASVSLAGRNLLAITPYSGFDPETNVAGQSNGVRGFDFAEVPLPRTYSFTINLGF